MRSSYNSSLDSALYRSGESIHGSLSYAAPVPDSTYGLSGIGLLMQQDEVGSPVYIKSIVPGGSCDRDGVCRPEDTVVAVNNEKVSQLPVVEIREKIVGPMGSPVIILFQRPNGEYYERTLIRGTPAFFEEQDRGLPHGFSSSSGNALPDRPRISSSFRERVSANSLLSRSVGSHTLSQFSGEQYRERSARPDDFGTSAVPVIRTERAEAPAAVATTQSLRNSFRDNSSVSAVNHSNSMREGSVSFGTTQQNVDSARFAAQLNAPQFLSRSLDGQSLQPAILPQNISQSFDRSKTSVEGELAICKDELSRTKALLEQDKAASMRYVKEIDILQRKNADQVMQLQSLLNQSEQTRRELEIQVANGRSREDEFHSAFARAKEQTEAREQYFAELKRQFEEARLNWERDISREKTLRTETERARDQARENLDRVHRDINTVKENDKVKREKEEEIRKYLQDAENKLVAAKQLEAKIRGHFKSMCLQYSQWQNDFFSSKSREETDLEQFFLLA